VKASTKKPRLSLRMRECLLGLAFISPFLVGFTLFFLSPFLKSIGFSFGKIKMTIDGYELDYVGLENFRRVLFVSPDFVRTLLDTVRGMLIDIPAIIIFSLFIATVLNQKFFLRTTARAIFFLPVILAAGVVLNLEEKDFLSQMIGFGGPENTGMLDRIGLRGFLYEMKLPVGFIDYIMNAVNHVSDIINASGIPILVFLAALQSIPSSMYEVATMEGATGWESFWKITFPLISPLFLTNTVYIVIDSFTSQRNALVKLIYTTAWGSTGGGYGESVAMSIIYFAVVILMLAVTFYLFARRVFYEE